MITVHARASPVPETIPCPSSAAAMHFDILYIDGDAKDLL